MLFRNCLRLERGMPIPGARCEDAEPDGLLADPLPALPHAARKTPWRRPGDDPKPEEQRYCRKGQNQHTYRREHAVGVDILAEPLDRHAAGVVRNPGQPPGRRRNGQKIQYDTDHRLSLILQDYPTSPYAH
jgi:hypothetical protein